MKNDDAELIQRVLAGDETAFSVLVKKYQRSVHALVWRKIGDFHIAEDITQDTFLKAYQRLSTLKKPQRFASWLYVIAANHCSTWLRKKRLWTQSLEETNSAQLEKATYSGYVIAENEQTTAEAQREVVKKLLAKLQESDRTVITLYYLGEMTYEEISEFLGVSVAAIKNRLYRARRRLKEEEPMIREALGNFQITPNLTENIMREISRLKPVTPSGNKPLVPWAIGVSTLAVVLLMLGIGNQYMSRFQKPYSFDATSEMTVEIIEAPVVLNLESKPDVRTQLGSAKALNSSNGLNQQPDPPEYMARFAAASVDETEDQAAPIGGTVRGHIKDTTLLENPLSEVQVVLVNTDVQEFKTQTDAEGAYELVGLPAGRYLVSIYKPGYQDRVGKPVSVIDSGRHYVPMTMNKSENLVNTFLNFFGGNKNRNGVLRFSVYSNTKPAVQLEGIEIKITADGPDPLIVTGVSNALGQYQSDGLSPGRYIVTINKDGYHVVCPMTVYKDRITRADIQLPDPNKIADSNVPPAPESDALKGKNIIHGKIREMFPFPTMLSDVEVEIRSVDGIVFNRTTNADGEYEFIDLPAGRYLIDLHKDGYIDRKGIPIVVTNNGNHIATVIEEDMFASYVTVARGGLLELTHGMRKK